MTQPLWCSPTEKHPKKIIMTSRKGSPGNRLRWCSRDRLAVISCFQVLEQCRMNCKTHAIRKQTRIFLANRFQSGAQSPARPFGLTWHEPSDGVLRNTGQRLVCHVNSTWLPKATNTLFCCPLITSGKTYLWLFGWLSELLQIGKKGFFQFF